MPGIPAIPGIGGIGAAFFNTACFVAAFFGADAFGTVRPEVDDVRTLVAGVRRLAVFAECRAMFIPGMLLVPAAPARALSGFDVGDATPPVDGIGTAASSASCRSPESAITRSRTTGSLIILA